MSFTLTSQLRKSLKAIRKPSYTASHVAVLCCLADRINDRTGICFPSMETIADESYIGERQARKIIAQLEKDGIVQVMRFPRRSSHYRLYINGHARIDKQDISAPGEAGFSTLAEAVETPGPVPDAPLTYKPQPLIQSGRDASFSPFNDRASLLSEEGHTTILSDERCKTHNPVSSRERSAPCREVKDLHALLMRKTGSRSPEPSAKDVELLQAAITDYGLGELYQLVEWVFKSKNKFWKDKLKGADHPCSFLSRSLPSIRRQFEAAEDEKQRMSILRELNRSKEPSQAQREHHAPDEDGAAEVETDSGGFTDEDFELGLD